MSPGETSNLMGHIIAPEDRESGRKEHILEGVPKNAFDSALLFGEEIKWLEVYSKTEGEKKAKNEKLLHEHARQLLEKPEEVEVFFRYWDEVKAIAIEEDADGTVDQVQNFIKDFTQMISSEAAKNLESLNNPQMLGKYLKLAVDSPYKDVYESILSSMFEGVQNFEEEKEIEQSINLLYNLCLASIESGDDQIINYVLMVTSFKTRVLAYNSPVMKNYFRASVSPSDDMIKKFSEIDTYIDHLSLFFLGKEGAHKRTEMFSRSMGVSSVKNYISRRYKEDPQRIQALMDFYDFTSAREAGEFSRIPDEMLDKFPFDIVVRDQGPLLLETQRLLARFKSHPSHKLLAEPGTGAVFYDTEGLDDQFSFFREKLINCYFHEKQPDETVDLNNAEIESVITYLRDELKSVERIRPLMELKNGLQEDLLIDPVRGLSERGNEVVIRDETLKSFGFTKIIFRKGARVEGLKRGDTLVEVFLGNYRLQVALDEKYRMITRGSRKPLDEELVNMDSMGSLMFKTWVLGHLHEILCKEPEEFTKNNLPTEKEKKDFERGYVSRTGHRRRIYGNPDFVPNKIQRDLATEQKGWDLISMNKLRREKGLPPVTYVREIEVTIPEGVEVQPVKVYADSATTQYNEIVK